MREVLRIASVSGCAGSSRRVLASSIWAIRVLTSELSVIRLRVRL